MSKLRIKIFGYRGPFGSVERLEKEFTKLGHEITNDYNCNLIVHTTGAFNDAEEYYNKCVGIKPIRIYTLLDIDPAKPIEWYNGIKRDLEKCEVAAAISQTVADQISEKLNIKRKIEVIHYPIRPITYLKFVKGIEFLYVGRLYSQNKRFKLGIEALQCAGFDPIDLCVAGTETPPINCHYIPSPDDDLLNQLYNSSRFLISVSRDDGQSCCPLESISSGCIPVLTKDNDVIYEFGLGLFAADPTSKDLATKIHDMANNPEKYIEAMNDLRPKFLEKFSINNIAQNIIKLYHKNNEGKS